MLFCTCFALSSGKFFTVPVAQTSKLCMVVSFANCNDSSILSVEKGVFLEKKNNLIGDERCTDWRIRLLIHGISRLGNEVEFNLLILGLFATSSHNINPLSTLKKNTIPQTALTLSPPYGRDTGQQIPFFDRRQIDHQHGCPISRKGAIN